jgi:hypothetical protein
MIDIAQTETYSVIRPTIKTGDILAWSHGSWKSWYMAQLNLVRIATRSEFNHVGVAWVVGGRVLVLEAIVPKIVANPLSDFLPCYHVPMNLGNINDKIMAEKLGGDYSKWEAIRGFLNDKMLEENTKWQCSKHVQWIHMHNNPEWANVKSTPSAVIKFALEELGEQLYFVKKF